MASRVVPVKFNRTDALSLWHDVTLSSVLDEGPDLLPRQIVILTTIYLDQKAHTVRSLAHKLNVTKAVITRAIDSLESQKLLRRCPDPADKRSIIIERTPKGTVYLTRFADNIRESLKSQGRVA